LKRLSSGKQQPAWVVWRQRPQCKKEKRRRQRRAVARISFGKRLTYSIQLDYRQPRKVSTRMRPTAPPAPQQSHVLAQTTSGVQRSVRRQRFHWYGGVVSEIAIFHQLGIDNARRRWDNTPWSFVLASGTHSIKAACLLVDSNAVAPILSERVAQAYL
jgi:hypothetical protein